MPSPPPGPGVAFQAKYAHMSVYITILYFVFGSVIEVKRC